MKKFLMGSLAFFTLMVFSFYPLMAAGPVRGGTFVVAVPESPDRMDGHSMSSASAYWFAAGMIYNGILTGAPDYKIEPDLAKSWEVKEGGKVWDFTFHEGVKFHDGSELTGEIVKWNFERALDPKTGYPDRKDFEDSIEKIEVTGKYKVRFHLRRASPIFNIAPLSLNGRSIMMVSKEAVEKLGKDFTNRPVGTGPFKVVEFVRGSHVRLERHKDYFRKGLPYFDKVLLKIIPDATTRFAALRTGEIHMMFDIPSELVPMIQKTPGLTYLQSEPCSYVWLWMNADPEAEKVGAAFFKDVRVRRAFSYAIDREELVKLVAPGGLGVPAFGGPIPPGSPYHHKIKSIKYDPERARQLLKEAGYTNLKVKLETNNSKAMFTRALEVMKEQLSRIGVEAEVEVGDKASRFPRLYSRPAQSQASLEDLEFCLEPSYMSRYYGKGNPQNYGRWFNQEAHELFSQGLIESDFNKRKKIYDRIQEIITEEDVVRLILWYGVENIVSSNKLKGYVFTPYYNHVKWEKAYLEK